MFVLQTANHQIVSEVAQRIVDAIRLEEFLGHEAPSYRLQSSTEKIKAEEIPVGTIEWTEAVSGITLSPMNLPKDLCKPPYACRAIIRANTTDFSTCFQSLSQNRRLPVFVKSDSRVKGFEPQLTTKQSDVPADSAYFLSEKIEILAEWRAFVFRNQILDVRRYLGPWTEQLPLEYCQSLPSLVRLASLPTACTIDLALTKKNVEWIEVHNFIACGLYGFDDPQKILQMTRVAWREELSKKF